MALKLPYNTVYWFKGTCSSHVILELEPMAVQS